MAFLFEFKVFVVVHCIFFPWRTRVVRWVEFKSILEQQRGDTQGRSHGPDSYHERIIDSPLPVSLARTLDIKFNGNHFQIAAVGAAIEPNTACAEIVPGERNN